MVAVGVGTKRDSSSSSRGLEARARLRAGRVAWESQWNGVRAISGISWPGLEIEVQPRRESRRDRRAAEGAAGVWVMVVQERGRVKSAAERGASTRRGRGPGPTPPKKRPHARKQL